MLRRVPLIHTGEKTSSNKAGDDTKEITVVLVKAVDYLYVHKLYRRLSGKRLRVRCYILATDLPERGGSSLGDLLGTRGTAVTRLSSETARWKWLSIGMFFRKCVRNPREIHSVILCMVQDTIMNARGLTG